MIIQGQRITIIKESGESYEKGIMNLKDAGCDEELITQCIKKYNNDDLKMLIKSLQCHRCCLLDKLHEEQKKIDCLDYLIYSLKKKMEEE